MSELEGQTTQPVTGLDFGNRETILSDLFVALADTLVDDFDVAELLDRLVQTCVEVLDVAAAGVLLLDGRQRLNLVASTSHSVEELEVFQVQADEGPCLDCARTRRPLEVPDLDVGGSRWPRFSATARALGFRAVNALPLRLRSQAIGGLNLFHSEPMVMPARDVHVAQALADVATIGILQQQHVQQAAILTDQLEGALTSRIVIEQAKGILAQSGNVTMSVAFAQLRQYARDHNLKLSAVAQGTVDRDIAPATIVQGRQAKSIRP
jgi:GAF domain-containing protein